MKNKLAAFALLIVAVILGLWLLKVAIRIALLVVLVLGAAFLFTAVRDRIGGPRA